MIIVNKIIKDMDINFGSIKNYKEIRHDQVTEMIRKQLIAQRLLSVVRVIDHNQDGNRAEVDVEVEFIDVDNPESSMKVRGFGYGIDTQDKGPGKAISYAVKYIYLKTFCLLTGDDPERDNIDHEPRDKTTFTKPEAPIGVKKERLRNFVRAIGGWEVFVVEAKDKLDTSSVHNWTEEEFDTAIAICRSIEEKNRK
jgi:hypothetical protein